MSYKPKVVKGKVSDTGWPIDGHVLYFSLWSYDNHEKFHLYGWEPENDQAVMRTMYQTEREADLTDKTFGAFQRDWKCGKWEAAGAFVLGLDKVEVLEVVQEEENFIFSDAAITPHKAGDGGILCMPRCSSVSLPDTTTWKRVPCPICGTECWLTDFAQKTLEAEPNLKTACTRCALKAAGDIIEEA